MIEIFSAEYCPYCKKVLAYAKSIGMEEGKDFKVLDITADENRERLIKVGGKKQVPFLIDGDVHMYESDDIIKYLEKAKA